MEERDRLSNKGNINDIKCSLALCDNYSIKELEEETEYEKSTRNRVTVVKLYEARIRKLKKEVNIY